VLAGLLATTATIISHGSTSRWNGRATPPLVDKRSHLGDELCRLIDEVALATNRNRHILRLATPLDAGRLSRLPRTGRLHVCVHPGAGTETRQWSAEHFAALIDLLAANHDVDIFVIGGADENRSRGRGVG
jgi:ADP-heptose:LPS heptosyltransferase